VDDNSKENLNTDKFLRNECNISKSLKNSIDIIYMKNKKRFGTVACRNLGIKTARGNVVAFLDDDGFAHKDWLKMLAKHYSNDEIVGVGGPVIEIGRKIKTPKSKVKKLAEITEEGEVVSHYRIKNISDYKKLKQDFVPFLQGGNMSFRKGVLLKVHGADIIFSGNFYREETDLSLKVGKMGKLFFEPKAITYHDTAFYGGNREVVKFNINDFLFWYYRNTALLFLKHFDFLDSVNKLLKLVKKQVNLLMKGKTGLTRDYLKIRSSNQAIVSVFLGSLNGVLTGSLNRNKQVDSLFSSDPEYEQTYSIKFNNGITYITTWNGKINFFKRIFLFKE